MLPLVGFDEADGQVHVGLLEKEVVTVLLLGGFWERVVAIDDDLVVEVGRLFIFFLFVVNVALLLEVGHVLEFFGSWSLIDFRSSYLAVVVEVGVGCKALGISEGRRVVVKDFLKNIPSNWKF